MVALAAYGVMDGLHHYLMHNTGMPRAGPGFCMTADVSAAASVAMVMLAGARDERMQQSVSPV